MIELKVHCDCGQKYKFDVEPVNGQMPFTVACPICKRDGTAKANEMLQQMAIFKMVEPASGTAPAPAAPPPIPVRSAAPPPAMAAAPRLRISASAPAAAPASESHTPSAAPPPIAPAGVALSPTGGRSRMAPAETAAEPGKQPSFAMGLLGAFVGALVGAILYFALYKATGTLVIAIGRYFLAIGVGGLAGWLANYFGRGEGSKELGGLAAVFTVCGILAAQYFISLDRWHKALGINGEVAKAIEDGGYSANVKEANEVVKAIPTGSDAEIRAYLAKQQAEEGQAPKLETISNDEIKQFRESELTNYQDLASGKLTREQYWAKTGFDPKEARKEADDEEDTVKGFFILLTVSRGGIISMIAGAGLAFKLCANA